MVANSGKQWQTTADSGKQRQTVANSGIQWQTVANNGTQSILIQIENPFKLKLIVIP